MTEHISPDPDPIRHSAPSGGGEVPTPDEDPTPPDAPVGEAAGVADESPPDGTIEEADGGVIETDAAMGGEDTVAENDLLEGGEVERGD